MENINNSTGYLRLGIFYLFFICFWKLVCFFIPFVFFLRHSPMLFLHSANLLTHSLALHLFLRSHEFLSQETALLFPIFLSSSHGCKNYILWSMADNHAAMLAIGSLSLLHTLLPLQDFSCDVYFYFLTGRTQLSFPIVHLSNRSGIPFFLAQVE